MSLKKIFAATLVAATTFGTAGCSSNGIGMRTVGGGAVGALGTSLLTKNPAVIALGGIAGAAFSNAFEPSCQTKTTSSGSAAGYGDARAPWRTQDNYKSTCNYSGNNPAGNWGTPNRLGGYMGGDGSTQTLAPGMSQFTP